MKDLIELLKNLIFEKIDKLNRVESITNDLKLEL